MTSTLDDSVAGGLGLREVAPRERHATIFAGFDALQSGQSLQLLNDHDPQPLPRRAIPAALAAPAAVDRPRARP